MRHGLGKEDWEVWTALETLYQSGRTKMIGISNVTAEQLRALCEKAKVRPMVVQNRCYAMLKWDQEVREICEAQGIIYQGFSLLTANPEVIRDQGVTKIAGRVGSSPLQVIFRFAQQIGMLPLTGTTNPQHMKEDLAIKEFDLTPEEINYLEKVGSDL